MTKEFLEKLKKIKKTYFTLSDLEKIWGGKRNVLKVVLFRLTKKGQLKRIQKNIYVLPEMTSNVEKIANEIYFPSYLSFESALSKWGILSQIPYALTFATTLKTRKIEIEKTKVEYRKIKKDLFFGYKLMGGIYLALPEKAILDSFYLASMGKLKINFENLDLKKIKERKFFQWLKKYPEKTKKLVEKFI